MTGNGDSRLVLTAVIADNHARHRFGNDPWHSLPAIEFPRFPRAGLARAAVMRRIGGNQQRRAAAGTVKRAAQRRSQKFGG
jgi:hypothetical protein